MIPQRSFLELLRHVTAHLGRETLSAAARRNGRSLHGLRREFLREAGETPKQFTLRLQLERAAAQLACCRTPVRSVALQNGFASHEVFLRAFRRYFGVAPRTYRNAALQQATPLQRRRHLQLTRLIGPGVRFFHRPRYKSFSPRDSARMPIISIQRVHLEPQHVLRMTRRIAPSELQRTLGECFGALFTHAARRGLAIAGWPTCRYLRTGLGIWTVEPMVPLAGPAESEGEMQAGLLPGGWAVRAIHAGPYEQLPDTNAEIERWIEANGYASDGTAWEQYVTDPTEHSDSRDWRTEVVWPLQR